MSDKIKEYEKIVYIRAVGTEHLFQVGSEDIKAKFLPTKVKHTFRPGDIGYGLFNTSGSVNWLNEYHTEKDYIALLDEVMINQFNTEQEEEKQKTLGDTFKEQPVINPDDMKGSGKTFTPKLKKVAEDIAKIIIPEIDKTIPKKSSFEVLYDTNCKTFEKDKFTYISWATCWKEVKLHDPKATFKTYCAEDGYPAWIKKGIGAFVKVGVTIDGIEYIEVFAVTDHRNLSMLETSYNKTYKNAAGCDLPQKTKYVEKISSFDINYAIKRALVKACSYAGFGLKLYDKEDLSNNEDDK